MNLINTNIELILKLKFIFSNCRKTMIKIANLQFVWIFKKESFTLEVFLIH